MTSQTGPLDKQMPACKFTLTRNDESAENGIMDNNRTDMPEVRFRSLRLIIYFTGNCYAIVKWNRNTKSAFSIRRIREFVCRRTATIVQSICNCFPTASHQFM